MATAGHAPTKSARPRKEGRGWGEEGIAAKAAQIISHHLSVKIRILNKRATRNYHGPGIKAAQSRDQKRPQTETRETVVSWDLGKSGAARLQSIVICKCLWQHRAAHVATRRQFGAGKNEVGGSRSGTLRHLFVFARTQRICPVTPTQAGVLAMPMQRCRCR